MIRANFKTTTPFQYPYCLITPSHIGILECRRSMKELTDSQLHNMKSSLKSHSPNTTFPSYWAINDNGLRHSNQVSKHMGQGTTLLENDSHSMHHAKTLHECRPPPQTIRIVAKCPILPQNFSKDTLKRSPT